MLFSPFYNAVGAMSVPSFIPTCPFRRQFYALTLVSTKRSADVGRLKNRDERKTEKSQTTAGDIQQEKKNRLSEKKKKSVIENREWPT